MELGQLEIHFDKHKITAFSHYLYGVSWPWVRKICWRRDRLPTPVFLGFPCGSAGKESACNVGDLGLVPGLGRSPGEGKGYPLQYSSLENSMDCIVHVRHKESDTTERLSHAKVGKYDMIFTPMIRLLIN